MQRLFIILLLAFVIGSCSSNKEKLQQISWLKGSWSRQYNGVTQTENWNITDSSILGDLYFVHNNDSSLMSSYEIKIKENNIILVTHETEFESIVEYQLSYFSKDSLIFKTKYPVWPSEILIYHQTINTYIKSLSGQQQQMNNYVHFQFIKD